MSTERTKWHTGNMPAGYPQNCDTNLLKEVVQDLNDEYVTKKKGGKINVIWENIIKQLIEAGNEEIRQRTQLNGSEHFWFSMNNPFVYTLVIVALAFVAYCAYKLGWPLIFGFN